MWRFPRNPLGPETLPFQFAFYLCRWNDQTSGDRKTKCGGSGNGLRAIGYSLFRIRGSKPYKGPDKGECVRKRTQEERTRTRNGLSSPAILNTLVVSSLQVRTAVFARSPSVGRVLWHSQYLAYRQGYETCPTATIPFTTVGCAFRVLEAC